MWADDPEIITVEEDRRPWWKRYRLYFAPGTWLVALVSGVIALLVNFRPS